MAGVHKVAVPRCWCPGRGSARAAQAGRSPHFPPAKVLMTYRHTRTWVTPRAGWPRPSDLGVPLGEMHAPMASLSQLRESELGICECSRYVDVFSSFFLFCFVFSFHSFEGHSENPFGKRQTLGQLLSVFLRIPPLSPSSPEAICSFLSFFFFGKRSTPPPFRRISPRTGVLES